MNKIVLVVIGALGLAGCDNGGVGVSAGIEQGTGTKTAQTLQQSKEITQAKQEAVYVERKLFPVIADAAKEITGSQSDLLFTGQVMRNLVMHLESFTSYTERKPIPAELHPTLKENTGLSMDQIDMLLTLKPLESKAEVEAFATAMIINLSTYPAVGWLAGFNSPDLARAEMSIYTSYGLIASEVMAKVAIELAAMPMTDQAQLKEQAVKLIKKHSVTGERITTELYKERGFTRDLANSAKPVHFTTANGLDVSVSSSGIEITQFGDVWFGAGYVDGKQYTARVSVSRGSNMKKGSSTETGTATDERQKAGANVNAG